MSDKKRIGSAAIVALLGLALLAVSGGAFGEQEETDSPGFMAVKGRITYGRYCANCHGADGKGEGSIAKFLKIPPSDLTRVELDENGEFPYERLESVIDGRLEVRGHGAREMPLWGNIFQSPLAEEYATSEERGEERAERMIRELIFYLETIQADESPEAPADS